MTPTMKDLGIDRLTPEQRVALALEIWESLVDAHPPERESKASHEPSIPAGQLDV